MATPDELRKAGLRDAWVSALAGDTNNFLRGQIAIINNLPLKGDHKTNNFPEAMPSG